MKIFINTVLILTFASAASLAQEDMKPNRAEAVFAAGCFWCIESDFEKQKGVIDAISGYAGGSVENPTYDQVSGGGTGHKEVVKVVYDPHIISYNDLLKTFWQNVDPFDDKGQFCDKGDQYKAAIFYGSEDEQKWAQQSKMAVEESILKKKVATTIEPLNTFYPAEDYHQNFAKTHETKYKFYRWKCGRDKRLEAVWNGADISVIGVH